MRLRTLALEKLQQNDILKDELKRVLEENVNETKLQTNTTVSTEDETLIPQQKADEMVCVQLSCSYNYT